MATVAETTKADATLSKAAALRRLKISEYKFHRYVILHNVRPVLIPGLTARWRISDVDRLGRAVAEARGE